MHSHLIKTPGRSFETEEFTPPDFGGEAAKIGWGDTVWLTLTWGYGRLAAGSPTSPQATIHRC